MARSEMESRALKEAPDEFFGWEVIIAHGRMFFDWVATHVLADGGNCHFLLVEGNYHVH